MQYLIKHIYSKLTTHSFVKVSLWSAVTTFARIISGFFTIKLSAIYIGAAGLAIVSQYTNTIVFVALIGSGCINQGLTTYIARFYDNPKEQETWVRSGISVTIISSVFISILIFIFRAPITQFVFNNSDFEPYTISLAFTLVLMSVNTTLIGILNGFKEYKTIVYSNVCAAFLALIFGIILIPNFGIKGALINALANQSVLLFITLFFIRNKFWAKDLIKITLVEFSKLKLLFGFSIMVIVNSTLPPATLILIRNTILEHYSLESAGYWDATTRVTYILMMVLMTTYTMYYLPRIAELKTDREIKTELLNTIKIVVPIVSTLFLIAYLSKDLIIYVVFNDSFNIVREYIGIQLLGEFLRMLSWFFIAIFYAKEKVKWFIIFEISFHLFWYVFTLILINNLAMYGVFWSYVLASAMYLVLVVFFFRKILYS